MLYIQQVRYTTNTIKTIIKMTNLHLLLLLMLSCISNVLCQRRPVDIKQQQNPAGVY